MHALLADLELESAALHAQREKKVRSVSITELEAGRWAHFVLAMSSEVFSPTHSRSAGAAVDMTLKEMVLPASTVVLKGNRLRSCPMLLSGLQKIREKVKEAGCGCSCGS